MNRNNKGFTLVEMLIAMVIILVAMMGLYKTVIVAIEGNTRTLLRNEGTKLAEQIINEIRGLPYDDITAMTPWDATTWNAALGYVPPLDRKMRKMNAQYAIVVNVTENAPLKTVNVIVGWDFKRENTNEILTNVTQKEFETSISTIVRTQ
ncbi:MAG: prepilin-type N-terminal cleavage/methylation domain-containing protein [Nitrospirota bacterium]|nr:MAG: prepilin-type N-terminal cleavage/methylation domain-containing protein [Nitrospirota bacterium]